jgi:YihY family inner membrane protein
VDAPEETNGHADRARVALTRIVERIGGMPAVQRLVAVFESYDHGGGGLSANGLAYSALFALVPGLLLVLAVIGIFITDPALQDQLVQGIAALFPPLAPLVETAFAQVSAGAVPTSIVAVIGLLWGSSRFYAALDYAFSRVFRTAARRNEIERGLRGILVSVVFIALPIVVVLMGAIATWLIDLAPGVLELGGAIRGLAQLGSPVTTWVLFTLGVALVYRFVPNTRVRVGDLGWPAILAGTAIALFTQIFTFIAPRMLQWAALFGALLSVFAVLIWLSISLNVLLFGAAWTRVRVRERADPEPEVGRPEGAAADT